MKSKLLSILTIIFSLFVLSATTQAQGIYSKKKAQEDSESSGAGIMRAADSDGFGDPNDGTEDGEAGDPAPVGEGLLILSLLGGSYAILQRNKKEKI